jgi:hypothetical protein
MIGEGRKSYVVMATAADTTAPVRTIKHLDTDLFVGEDLVDVNGDTYLTLKSRIDYRNV